MLLYPFKITMGACHAYAYAQMLAVMEVSHCAEHS